MTADCEEDFDPMEITTNCMRRMRHAHTSPAEDSVRAAGPST